MAARRGGVDPQPIKEEKGRSRGRVSRLITRLIGDRTGEVVKVRPLQVDFLFLVNDFPTSDEGKGENRNLETFLLSVSGQKEYQYLKIACMASSR